MGKALNGPRRSWLTPKAGPAGLLRRTRSCAGNAGSFRFRLEREARVRCARLRRGRGGGGGGGGESGSAQDRHHDRGQEQQDAAAHRLPHAVHPAGRAGLHRHLQGLRQAHEPHPLRLRRVPQDQAQELEAAGAGGEAGPGPGVAPRREPGLHDGRGPAAQRYRNCSRPPSWSSWRPWRWQSCRKRRPGRSPNAPGSRRFGRACAWGWWTVTAGDDSSESRDSSCSCCSSHCQHCRSSHPVRTRPWRSASSHGQRYPSPRNDGPPSWHETAHGPSDGHAPWPRLANGDATPWDAAATPWDARSPSSWHASAPALK